MKKTNLLRWTLQQAGDEFNIDPKTVKKRLAAASIEPGQDGCFSTAQICKAIYGDFAGQKLRLLDAQSKRIELENARTERNQVPVELVQRVWSAVMIEFRQRVLDQGLPPEARNEMLEILSDKKIDEYFEQVIKDIEENQEVKDDE